MKIKYLARGSILSSATSIILVLSLASCRFGPEPVTPKPEEKPPAAEARILSFSALRMEIFRGECTALEWQVEGGFGVELDGRPVNPADGMDICPEETTTYWLRVDGGDRIVEQELTVWVYPPGDAGEEEPRPQESTEQPSTQGDISPTEGAGQPAAPPPTVPPTTPPPAAPGNCYSSSTNYITDLAITDVYAGNQPLGQIWVRVTNHGPVACTSVSFPYLGCAMVATPISGGTGVASSTSIPVTLNIQPGETQSIPTGMGIDTSQWTYLVTCHFAAQSGYSDLNNGNQYYQEAVP